MDPTSYLSVSEYIYIIPCEKQGQEDVGGHWKQSNICKLSTATIELATITGR